MLTGAITVGTTAVEVPVAAGVTQGLKLLARDGNSGDVYMGTAASVTTSTGSLVAKGTPDVSYPTVVPAQHFEFGGKVYLIGSGAGQVVDWSHQ